MKSTLLLAAVTGTLAFVAASSPPVFAADNKPPRAKTGTDAPQSDNGVVQAAPAVKSIESVAPGRCRIFLEWTVASRPNEDWIVSVHFFDENGEVKLNADFGPNPPTSTWKPGTVVLEPHNLNLPAELTGTFELHVGLYQIEGTGSRAALIDNMTSVAGRYVLVGQVKIEDGTVKFLPPKK